MNKSDGRASTENSDEASTSVEVLSKNPDTDNQTAVASSSERPSIPNHVDTSKNGHHLSHHRRRRNSSTPTDAAMISSLSSSSGILSTARGGHQSQSNGTENQGFHDPLHLEISRPTVEQSVKPRRAKKTITCKMAPRHPSKNPGHKESMEPFNQERGDESSEISSQVSHGCDEEVIDLCSSSSSSSSHSERSEPDEHNNDSVEQTEMDVEHNNSSVVQNNDKTDQVIEILETSSSNRENDSVDDSAMGEIAYDSSDDDMVMLVEKTRSTAAERRKQRRALASGIRRGKVERAQFFSSLPSAGEGQSQKHMRLGPVEPQDPSALFSKSARSASGVKDDASVIDLMSSSDESETGIDDRLKMLVASQRGEAASKRKKPNPTRKVNDERRMGTFSATRVAAPRKKNSHFQGATPLNERQDSRISIGRQCLIKNEAPSPPLHASPQERGKDEDVFSKLVYGLTSEDQVSFWQGSRFTREPSSFFSFEDDPVVEDDNSNSSDQSSFDDGEESDEDSDSSSDREVSQKSMGEAEPSEFQCLRRYEECLPERETVVTRVEEIKTRELAIINNQIPPEMSSIAHMSKVEYDSHGRPIWEFVVYGGCDETLFKFRIDVRPSTIPGAGLGAFMTYLGSLHLDPKLRAINSRVIQRRRPHIPKTTNLITFRRQDGQLGTLKLTGEDLHGNDNNLYWPDTMLPLKASFEIPGRKRPAECDVHIVGDHIHDDPEFSAMKNRGDTNVKRVGHLEALLPSDYYPGKQAFELQSSIYVGRYGPLRRQDRKPESLFLCKSFIFQYEPSGYCFQVGEEIADEVQIVDIMDDATGLNHAAALKSLPTYVNEVGHDLSRLQNVFISDYEDRSIEYNFVLPDNQKLKVGDCTELLTNYYSAYERNRQRHGYGRANLYEGKRGDDHLASYMKDRLRERSDTLNVVTTIDLFQMVDVWESLRENVCKPIQKLLKRFLESGDSPLSNLQLVGLRRVFWLRNRFEEIVNLKSNKLQEEESDEDCFIQRALVAQCRSELSSIGFHPYFLTRALHDERKLESGNSIASEIQKEAVEEACFTLRKRVIRPFDEAVWCPIGRTLQKRLGVLVAEKLWSVEQTTDGTKVVSAQKELLESLIQAGEKSAAEVRLAASNRDLSKLSFHAGIGNGMILTGQLSDMLRLGKRTKSFFLDHQANTPKGYIAAVAKCISYMDSVVLGDLVPQGSENILLDHDELFVMRSTNLGGSDKLSELASVPVSLGEFEGAEPNVSWYIVWQVLFLVEAFAKAYCGENSVTGRLCDRLGVPPLLGQFATQRGIQTAVDKGFKKLCRPSTKIIYKPQLDLPQSIRRSRAHASPLVERVHAAGGNARLTPVNKETPPAAGKNKPVSSKKTKSAGTGGKRIAAVLIWQGKPDEPIEGGWPDGWTKQTYERQNGETKGQTDSYWYSRTGKKLRSINEIQRFLAFLDKNNGDEEIAWAAMKGKSPPKLPTKAQDLGQHIALKEAHL